MKKKLFWSVILIPFALRGSTQDTVSLKLQDALNTAVKNNRGIALAVLDQESAVAKFNQTNAVFLPEINLSYTALVSNNPLNALGFKLQQQSVTPSDFIPQLLNNPAVAKNYLAKAEWNQPLLNLDLAYQRKAAKQQIDAYYYKKQRAVEYLTFDVRRSYTQLQLSYRVVTVLNEALSTANAIFERSKDYFEKGYLQKVDLLLVQVQIASIESKLAEAKTNVSGTSDYLSLLMGAKGGLIYLVDSLKKLDADGIEPQVSKDRADIKGMTSALKAQETFVGSKKMSNLPRLNAFANYVFNDRTALGFRSGSYLVGAQLSWNLFHGTASRYGTAEQKIAYSKAEQQLSYYLEQSQVELDKTYRQFLDAQFSITKHEISVAQAAEALRIRRDRFQQGLISTSELLESQSSLSEQQLMLSEAVFKYNTTFAYVEFLTSKDQK